jgi:hypothetical protein
MKRRKENVPYLAWANIPCAAHFTMTTPLARPNSYSRVDRTRGPALSVTTQLSACDQIDAEMWGRAVSRLLPKADP